MFSPCPGDFPFLDRCDLSHVNMILKQSMYKTHAKLNEDTQVGAIYKEGSLSLCEFVY